MKRGVIAFAVLAAAAGCSSSHSDKPSGGNGLSGAIHVDAASSLTAAFDTLKGQFQAAHPGTKVDIVYGASSDLSTQISQGAPVDVFASASTTNMTDLGSQAVNPKDFVTNKLEIAVPPSNPAHIGAVADLGKPGVKVAVCDPAVPCGAVAAQVFHNAGITVHPAAQLADVKSTLAAVESGEVDAGLVYVTDVRAAGNQVKGVAIANDVNATTTYPIAVLKTAKNPAAARAWVAYVLSDAGRKVLTADGFGRP